RHRPEDACSARVLQVIVQNNGSVVIEANVRTITTAVFLGHTHDHSPDDIALLDAALRRRRLHGRNHNVADRAIATSGATDDTDHQQLLSARVIGHLETGFGLDHSAASSPCSWPVSPTSSARSVTSASPGRASTSSTTQRLVLLSGLLSTIRTTEPTSMELLSSWACTFLVDTTYFL